MKHSFITRYTFHTFMNYKIITYVVNAKLILTLKIQVFFNS